MKSLKIRKTLSIPLWIERILKKHSESAYKAWYFFFFLGMGFLVPQISPFVYDTLQLKEPGIIFFLGQAFLPAGALLTGYISDKTLLVRPLQIVMCIIAGFSILVFSQMANPLYREFQHIILPVSWSIYGFAIGGIIPLGNVSFMQSGNDPARFGIVRMFGTIGFVIANIFLIAFPGCVSHSIEFSALFILVSIPFLFLLPHKRIVAEKDVSRITFKQVLQLLKSSRFMLFMLFMFLFFVHFSPAEYIISNQIKNIQFPLLPVPFSWTLGASMEVVFFLVSVPLLKKHGPLFLIKIAFIMGILRMGLMLFIEPGVVLMAMQVLHGLHYAPAYLGSLEYLQQKANPKRLATAQALLMIFGRAMGTGIGAFVLGNMAGLGNNSMLYIFAILAGLSGMTILYIYEIWQQKWKTFIV